MPEGQAILIVFVEISIGIPARMLAVRDGFGPFPA
jgi:hypothetical protein